MPGPEGTPRNGSAADPTGALVARAERALEARAHELESGLTWHLGRLRAASVNARRELEAGVVARRETLTRTLAVTSAGNRRIHRVLDRLHVQGRRSRAAVAGALVVAILAVTGAFVATQAAPDSQRAQRSTSTSIARSSPTTAGTTPRSPESVAATDATSTSDPPPASTVPDSRPGTPRVPGTSSAAGATAPRAGSGPTGTSPSPGSTGTSPPNASPPNSPPPRSPTCQLLPVVCP